MSIDVLPIRLALTAPDGRMGRTVSIAIAEDPRFIIDQNSADIVVDFSVPAALKATLERAVKAKTPVLIGTTGLDDFADQMIAEAALHIAILRAANTSLGVAVLCNLVEQAAGLLHDPWDIEIVEMHHRQKADSPSGTALALALAAKVRLSSIAKEPRSQENLGSLGSPHFAVAPWLATMTLSLPESRNDSFFLIEPRIGWFSHEEP